MKRLILGVIVVGLLYTWIYYWEINLVDLGLIFGALVLTVLVLAWVYGKWRTQRLEKQESRRLSKPVQQPFIIGYGGYGFPQQPPHPHAQQNPAQFIDLPLDKYELI